MIKTKELFIGSIAFLCALGAAGRAGADRDWLVRRVTEPVRVVERADGKEVVMDNALIRRTFRLRPNAATVGYDNLMTGESMLRAVKPEARVEIDGVRFDVGGLKGQPDHAYLLSEWLDSLRSNPEAFQFAGYEIGRTKERFAWRRRRYCADTAWPPAGASLSLHFKPPADKLKGLRLSVHYEMYEGIPLLCKWLSVHNGSGQTVRLNSYTSEILAMVEYESHVENYEKWNVPNIHVESDYSFAGMNAYVANQTTHWEKDPQYMTQVSYPRENPCLLESRPPVGPDHDIEPGGTFESFRTFELVFDSTERERKGLAVRRMYRTIAPSSDSTTSN